MLNAFRHQRKRHAVRHGFIAVDVIVLNAFRHQRKRHADSSVVIPSSTSAQRLSASTEKTLASRAASRAYHVGAQRLSASTEKTRGAAVVPARTLKVLNAFRHQRKRHAPIYYSDFYSLGVLNAFRHQRKRHNSRTSCNCCTSSSAQRLSASTEKTLVES